MHESCWHVNHARANSDMGPDVDQVARGPWPVAGLSSEKSSLEAQSTQNQVDQAMAEK